MYIKELYVSTKPNTQNGGGGTEHNCLILFYMPGCPHCVNFMPIWKTITKKLKNSLPKFTVKKIDGTKPINKPMVDKFSISGYPTIKLTNGSDSDGSIEYDGSRTVKDVIDFVHSVVN